MRDEVRTRLGLMRGLNLQSALHKKSCCAGRTPVCTTEYLDFEWHVPQRSSLLPKHLVATMCLNRLDRNAQGLTDRNQGKRWCYTSYALSVPILQSYSRRNGLPLSLALANVY